MKKFILVFMVALMAPLGMMAQGWPSNYGGVVLQGFFWDSFRQADGHAGQTMATM